MSPADALRARRAATRSARGLPPPVPVPHAPAPAGQAITRPVQPRVHRRAAPSRVRPEQPARLAPADCRNAVRRTTQAHGEIVRRHDHQPARPAVQPDRMTLVGHALHNRRGLRRDVLVDQKEGGAHAVVPQRIEERRRPVGIRTIVEREIESRRRPGLRLDLPERPRRAECFEQERKWSGMRQGSGAKDYDDDNEHARWYPNDSADPRVFPPAWAVERSCHPS